MSLAPATPQDIAAACQVLRGRGSFSSEIASGLERGDPDQMRAAVKHLIDGDRVEGLRELVERFRDSKDFGVWARVTSARLHQLASDYAAGLADIDDLMARFPARAGAHWWLAKARCLEGLERGDEAEAAAIEGAKRFPGETLNFVFRANLLLRLKRPAEALEAWREVDARFPEPELDWLVGSANALKALGRREAAIATLEDAAHRFPNDRRTPSLRAQVAEERNQWSRALAIWDSQGAPGEPQTILGRARALFRLGRVDEATATLDAGLAQKPDHVALLRERSWIAIEVGDDALARDLLTTLTERFAAASRPEWWGALARARHDLGDLEGGAAALAELERRFPNSALGEAERLRFAKERDLGHDDLGQLISEALKRRPDDPNLLSHWVWILLSDGRLEEAEAVVVRLEADEAPGHALASRLRLEADRGDAALRTFVLHARATETWSAADAIQFVGALLDVRTPWAFELGGDILEEVAERFAGHFRLDMLRIRLMIARRQTYAALALIDAIPSAFVRREQLELRAYAAAQRAQHDEAKRLWAQALAGSYYAAVHSEIHTLTRVSPDDRPPADGRVTAYVVFRNEAAQIPGFLAHHRRLGVTRFVFFNHMSSDESRALCLNEPDVILYDCPDSYQLSWSGRRWVNEIVAREGARGWGLQLDMDEHLLYPGCERVSLDRFLKYLDGEGYEGVRGFMFDVFPPRLLDAEGAPAPFSEYRYFDDDYYLFGLERPPYAQPGGGVRARLFEAKEFLHKIPLWRLDAGLLINSHETTHLKFADVSAALLHYKLMNVALRGRTPAARAGLAFLEADADVEAIRRHSRYAARLEKLWRADLRQPGVSRELGSSLELAERGLMDVSDAYRAWLSGATR